MSKLRLRIQHDKIQESSAGEENFLTQLCASASVAFIIFPCEKNYVVSDPSLRFPALRLSQELPEGNEVHKLWPIEGYPWDSGAYLITEDGFLRKNSVREIEPPAAGFRHQYTHYEGWYLEPFVRDVASPTLACLEQISKSLHRAKLQVRHPI